MLVAQGVAEFETQANQFFFVFFDQFLDFNDQHVAQADFGDGELFGGFIPVQDVPIFQESIALQRDGNVIALFGGSAETVFLSVPLVEFQMVNFCRLGAFLPLFVFYVAKNVFDH